MARSLKKGPFADESLLKKVDALNASNDIQGAIFASFSAGFVSCAPRQRAGDG